MMGVDKSVPVARSKRLNGEAAAPMCVPWGSRFWYHFGTIVYSNDRVNLYAHSHICNACALLGS